MSYLFVTAGEMNSKLGAQKIFELLGTVNMEIYIV